MMVELLLLNTVALRASTVLLMERVLHLNSVEQDFSPTLRAMTSPTRCQMMYIELAQIGANVARILSSVISTILIFPCLFRVNDPGII